MSVLPGHGTMSKTYSRYVTVFIPTFNGAKYLTECIESILHQQLPSGYKLELLIIDSGSSDGTLDIISRYDKKLTLVQIPNSEFSHGGTRAKAAHLAKGEYILFLTQDATPKDEHWLANMIEPFYLTKQIGCVFGRQVPRPNAAATIKREVATTFSGMAASDSILVHRSKSLINHKDVNAINTFFSDVNSAVRRDLLIGKVPFRDVNYAEDQSLAEDMQQKGYIKAYAPRSEVWHSNDYTARQYFHRKFDEYIGLKESVGLKQAPSIRSLLLGWIRPTWHDWKFIRRDREYSPRSKVVWFIESPFYNFAAKAGMYQALRHYKNDSRRKRLSLEHKSRG